MSTVQSNCCRLHAARTGTQVRDHTPTVVGQGAELEAVADHVGDGGHHARAEAGALVSGERGDGLDEAGAQLTRVDD